ncbi:MAG: RNA polymerase sigma factor [Armatimonadota bacterium]
MNEHLPDAELVDRALQGDPSAFAALCDRYRKRVWRIANSFARGADAEDLAQEAVLRAYRGLRSYQRGAPFDAWLCRIALNVGHDHLRSAWKRRVTLFDSPSGGPEEAGPDQPADEAQLREVQRRVRQEVASLPEPQRVPIWLHYFEGFTLAEVARMERIPEATLRSRMRAGFRRLSGLLKDLGPYGVDEMLPIERKPKGCEA